jgi:hypothetical protein
MKIHPIEASHRAMHISVDLAYMIAKNLDIISQFISKQEMFHIQLNTLYVLIDIMGATTNTDPQHVLDEAKQYFKSLEREKGNV